MELVELVKRSALYDGGHIGSDSRASDGIFETLTFTGAKGTVVLVTSGNSTFTQQGPRRALVSMLTGLEQRLLKRAKSIANP